MPVLDELIKEYDGTGGYGAKYVTDSPLITGLGRYSSIMISHPGGVDMIICVYWVRGSLRIVAENIRMVTLSKTFDIFSVTKELLGKQVRFLAAWKGKRSRPPVLEITSILQCPSNLS